MVLVFYIIFPIFMFLCLVNLDLNFYHIYVLTFYTA